MNQPADGKVTKMHIARRVLLHAACALGCVVALTLVLEGVLVTFDGCGLVDAVRVRQENAERQARGEPLVWEGAAWSPREFAQAMPLNGAGLLGPEFTPDTARPYRVAVVGDSFVEARQVPFDVSFVGGVQTRIPDVQPLPITVGNFPSRLRLEKFLDVHEQWFDADAPYPDLDLVVFQFRGQALNDALGPSTFQALRTKIIRRSGLGPRLRQLGNSKSRAVSFLATRTRVWTRFATSGQATRPGAREQAMRDAFETDLNAFAEASQQLGVPFAFFYVPTLAESRAPRSERDTPSRGTRAAFAQALNERNWPHRDATAVVPRGGTFYPWDQHPTPRGHVALADVLSELIQEARSRNE